MPHIEATSKGHAMGERLRQIPAETKSQTLLARGIILTPELNSQSHAAWFSVEILLSVWQQPSVKLVGASKVADPVNQCMARAAHTSGTNAGAS